VHSIASYILGILSIVIAIFQPLAGIILGIIGLVQGRNGKDDLSRKGRKLSIWGIVIGFVVLVTTVIFTIYALKRGISSLGIPN
jgi:VIT1/CCC1 family predicted Fe2+/Mn2+ transporter